VRATLLAVVLALVAQLGRAQADGPDDVTVKRLYEEGSQLYAAGKYVEAAEKFEAVYQIDPDPATQFNIGQAYRLARKNYCAKAAAAFRTFLRVAADPPNVETVKQYISEMDACVTQQQRDDRLASRPSRSPAGHGSARLGTLALGAAGLGLAAGGVYFSFRAAELDRERAQACPQNCLWQPVMGKVDSLNHSGAIANVMQWLLYPAAGAALGTTAYLYFVRGSSVERVSLVPTPHGASVSARWAF
jgi:hypothetical protein